jgi:ankyrin repeat protein
LKFFWLIGMLGKNAPEVVKDLFKLVEEWDNEDKLKQFKEKLAGIEGKSLVGLFKKLYDVGRNVFGEIYSATLLHYIVSRGAHQYLDALLEKMSKEDGILDVVDFNGDTALHLACMKGGDAVKQLLDKGADVTVANTKKETPLMLAARHGSSADVAAILAKIEELKGPTEKEAAINAQDSLGNTALQFACGKNEKVRKSRRCWKMALILHLPI